MEPSVLVSNLTENEVKKPLHEIIYEANKACELSNISILPDGGANVSLNSLSLRK